jgi:threonine/homoserine/homoserine lactone efflux protein
MIDPAKLATFAVVTGLVSLFPGPQMVLVMTQAAWRGPRAGAAALAGLQLGNATWFLLAGLGLGAVVLTFPAAFTVLAALGAIYLAWLGFQAFRHAGKADPAAPPRRAGNHALLNSLTVSLSNPKSLVYVIALLPPFLDTTQPIGPQLVVLAAVAISIDIAVGVFYVAAGGGLAAAMRKSAIRLWLERGVGAIFLLIAAVILVELYLGGGKIG